MLQSIRKKDSISKIYLNHEHQNSTTITQKLYYRTYIHEFQC